MISITSYEQLLREIEGHELLLVFSKTPQCSVCHADLPRVEALANEYKLPAYVVDVSQVPMALGQLNLFSSPTVILFYSGKESHRQARFIDFLELRYRIEQLVEVVRPTL